MPACREGCAMLLDIARPADEPDLRRLLRQNPMEGEIRISLEREPDYFGAAVVGCHAHKVIVVRDDATKRVKVMGQCSLLEAFVNGEPTRVGYLHQMRADRDFAAHGRGIVRGHQKLRELDVDDGPALYFTAIVADNRPARRFFEAGLKGMPAYRPLETFVTLALPIRRFRRPAPPGCKIERGRTETLDEVIACLARNARRYQLAPAWTREDLLSPERLRGLRPRDFHLARRGGRVIGCLALWDQRAFKQAIVCGYGRRLGRLRPVINFAAPMLGAPTLPDPGRRLQTAFVSHIAVDDDDGEVFLALLAAIRRDAVAIGLDYLLLGFAQRNPFLDLIRENYRCRHYQSVIYQVVWDDPAAPPIRLDGRCPHPEAAIL